MYRIFILLFVCLNQLLAHDMVNILRNGGFEGGLDQNKLPLYWEGNPAAVHVVKASDGYQVNSSLVIHSEGNAESALQSIPLKVLPGTRLQVYVSVRGPLNTKGSTNGAALFRVQLKNRQGEVILQKQNILRGSTAWQNTMIELAAPANAARLEIVLGIIGTSGDVVFDYLRLEQLPPVASSQAKTYPNLLRNGDFEIKRYWRYSQSAGRSIDITAPGYGGNGSALHLVNYKPVWNFADQDVAIPLNTRQIRLSGKIKYKNLVEGKKQESGRIYLRFFNSAGAFLPGGSPTQIDIIGSSDGWETLSEEIILPPGTARLNLSLGIANTTGSISFDSLRIQ